MSPTSLSCLELGPRNPSWPAVARDRDKGRTYDRNRFDLTALQLLLQAGGRPHIEAGVGRDDSTAYVSAYIDAPGI